MPITTTSLSGAPVLPKPKPFTWSYSRLKNFEVCPKRHWEIDIAKNFKDEDSEVLIWGNAVHAALAARCGPSQAALPVGMESFEPWAQKVLVGGGDVYVEQDLALTESFTSTGYFDKDVWFRAKGDLIKVVGDVALAADWKTGKILEDSVQLALTSACVFAKFPQVKAVRASYIWLKEDAESSETFYRSDMPALWRGLWPRIEALKQAHLTTNYPASPCRMCRSWCVVKSCPNNGKTFQ